MFFFFQAEDGIRDLYVTGVQTCALPIWPLLVLRGLHPHRRFDVQPARQMAQGVTQPRLATLDRLAQLPADIARSEEHTSELQSRRDLVCRLLLEKKN